MYPARVSWLPPGKIATLALILCASSSLHALGVRDYSQARHNRLLDFPGTPIVPEWTAYLNPQFSPDASLFLGIGWPSHPTDWTRQMALVSPRHFVYATHYPLGEDWQIAFLGNDGQQRTFGIQSQVPILNPQGQQTDLMLCTLTAEVPSNLGIHPFPVLNLPTEADYAGKQMLVCGSFVRTATMPLGGFTTLTDQPGFDSTRFIHFDYDTKGGGPDDCLYEGGDSGAPSFVMVDGKPAIVGTASGYDFLPDQITRNYMASIPTYLSELDALMEPQGYHMKRVYPEPVSLDTNIQASGTLRRMMPGGVVIGTSNTGANAAHNIAIQISFSTAPTGVSGPGWICEPVSPLVWNCRRGGLGSGTVSDLTATWQTLPGTGTIEISASLSCDGMAPETVTTQLTPLESYASWIQGTADNARNADPDHDGISNLLEYAFGGSPSQPYTSTAGGHALLPSTRQSGNIWLVSFPLRTDAVERGLAIAPEFASGDHMASWSSILPEGATVESAPYSPPYPGFQQVTISIPKNTARRFVRVKVSLAE